MKKYTLHLKQPLSIAPNVPLVELVELEADRILTNDVRFPWESHPRNLRLWVIGNEYGALGAVWADCEQGALDVLCDAGLAGGLVIEKRDCWVVPATFDKALDYDLIIALAEARGARADNLDKI